MTVTSCPPQIVKWHTGRLVGFDLETTGIDVEQDRVVTAATVLVVPGNPKPATMNRLADPGIEIPEGASNIHGITTEHAREHGEPIKRVLEDVTTYLAEALTDGTPVVGMNIVYDLTLLDRECLRHNVTPLTERVGKVAPIIDVRVIDKAVQPFRKGSRKLSDLCAHYGITLDNAHDSGADALAALRVAWCLAERYPKLQVDPIALHDAQVHWAAQQMRGFAAYRARQGQPLDDTDGTWPIRPIKTLEGAAQ